jgi:DNA replication protein DnaC
MSKPALPLAVAAALETLRLPVLASGLSTLAAEDPELAQRVLQVLEPLLRDELGARQQHRIARRIKEAQFVRLQTIDGFDFDYNPATRRLRKRYLQLVAADCVSKDCSAIFVGSAGLGKTHLARALGYRACQDGHRVLFVPCARLLNLLIAAEATKDLEREVKRLTAPGLLIIDELAYLSMSHQEASLFFQVISRRHDAHRPTAVTTNKPFAEWNQVFHSDATAQVIVDRLTERAEIFLLEGKSYRQTHRQGLTPATDQP